MEVYDDGEHNSIRKKRGAAVGDERKRDADHREQRKDHPHIHKEVNQEDARHAGGDHASERVLDLRAEANEPDEGTVLMGRDLT